jgi:hypothetical protein
MTKTCEDLKIQECPGCWLNKRNAIGKCWIISLKEEFGILSEKDQLHRMMYYTKNVLINEFFYVLEMAKIYYPHLIEKFNKLQVLL